MRAYKYEELETNSLRYNLAVNSSLFLDEDFGGESLAIFDSLSKRLFFNFSYPSRRSFSCKQGSNKTHRKRYSL